MSGMRLQVNNLCVDMLGFVPAFDNINRHHLSHCISTTICDAPVVGCFLHCAELCPHM